MTISLRQQVLQYRIHRKEFLICEKRGVPVYERYFFLGKEKLLYLGGSVGITLFFSWLFYRSIFGMLVLWPVGIYWFMLLQLKKGNKRKQKLEAEFKDCILSVAANLRAGYSIENAFIESAADINSLYGEGGLMGKELYRIKKGLYNNIPLEKLLQELGNRSKCNDIREFGEVFAIARLNGGRLPEIIQSTTELIGEKIALKQEIEVAISGRLLEMKIMAVIPFLLVGYIEIGNRGFFDVLYHNMRGRIIMTGCLLVYLAAYHLADKLCSKTG